MQEPDRAGAGNQTGPPALGRKGPAVGSVPRSLFAVARLANEPLLYVGSDFAITDLVAA